MVRKDALNDFYFFEFTKASFMAQDVIYPGDKDLGKNQKSASGERVRGL